MPRPLKPAYLRQRRNKKSTAAKLTIPDAAVDVPEIPNPDERAWHPLTLSWWRHVWESPMAGEYIPTDVDGLGRLALLIDTYYQAPKAVTLAEVRLQEARFGLSPLDRSRLSWEITKAEAAERKRVPRSRATDTPPRDPRKILRAV